MRYRELSRNLSVAHKSNVLWVPLLHHGTGPATLGNLSPGLMTPDTAGYRPQGGTVGVGVIKQFRCLQKKAMYKIISHSFVKNEKTILAQQEGNPYLKNPWLFVLKYLTSWWFFFFFWLLFKKRKCLSIADLFRFFSFFLPLKVLMINELRASYLLCPHCSPELQHSPPLLPVSSCPGTLAPESLQSLLKYGFLGRHAELKLN